MRFSVAVRDNDGRCRAPTGPTGLDPAPAGATGIYRASREDSDRADRKTTRATLSRPGGGGG